MSKRCDRCDRSAGTGNRRSHSQIKTKRRFHINLIRKTINGLRQRICTRCLRTSMKHLKDA